jgi:hypothetical protein
LANPKACSAIHLVAVGLAHHLQGASAMLASSSSIFDMANPTWMKTQSPDLEVLVF